MTKKWIHWIILSLCMSLCLSVPCAGVAASYGFPYVGVRLDIEPGWTVLTPETLADEAARVSALGLDADALRADYAVQRVVFDAYLPGGANVRLSIRYTEQSLALGAAEQMNASDRDVFLALFGRSPYQNAAWSDDVPDAVRCDWAMEVGGRLTSFAMLSTVHAGGLYTLTATGAGLSAGDLHAENERVFQAMVFVDAHDSWVTSGQQEDAPPPTPSPIGDDGKVTPVTLVGFTGVTTDEETTVYIQTLPNTELLLKTANNQLRGRADENGAHHFTLSTKREVVYEYTLTANAAGRTASRMSFSIERRMTDEALAEAYRDSARPLASVDYRQLASSTQSFAGTALTFHGTAVAFTDLNGFPCVLIYAANAEGVLEYPIWVLLESAIPLAEGDIRTVYGTVRGDKLPHADASGVFVDAPIVVCHSMEE